MNGVVLCFCKGRSTIRREPGVLDGVRQASRFADSSASDAIPNPNGAVVATGHHSFAIRAETGGINGIGMRHRGSQRLTRRGIPKSRRAIPRRSDDAVSIRTELRRVNRLLMAQGESWLVAAFDPHLRRRIGGGGEKLLAVGTEA